MFARIGSNVNMMKGSTLGLSNGKKPGAPKLENCVFAGINSTVPGGITIGGDVMIGPNTFVNQDVPSHSIVIGNPCKIIPRDGLIETGKVCVHKKGDDGSRDDVDL